MAPGEEPVRGPGHQTLCSCWLQRESPCACAKAAALALDLPGGSLHRLWAQISRYSSPGSSADCAALGSKPPSSRPTFLFFKMEENRW